MKQLERSGIPWPVLIHASAGGVGSIAIQPAKDLGASVATTVSGSNAAWALVAAAIRPVIGRIVPFDQTPEALAALSKGGLRGEVVISYR